MNFVYEFFNYFQVKVKSMKSYEDRVEKLAANVNELTNLGISVDEFDSLKADHEKFVSDWNNLSKK